MRKKNVRSHRSHSPSLQKYKSLQSNTTTGRTVKITNPTDGQEMIDFNLKNQHENFLISKIIIFIHAKHSRKNPKSIHSEIYLPKDSTFRIFS
jgi:hypothetical protein